MIMRLLLAGAVFSAALSARADEAAVRRVFEGKLRGSGAIETVQKVPWGDLYEVVIRSPEGPVIYYVDGAASVVIVGQAFDAKSGRNFTEERQRKLTAVKWDSLPLQWAITSKRGDGRRKIAILSDPVLGPKSTQQAKAVWCSKNRVQAWNDLVQRRVEPQAAPDCDTPVDKLAEYGRSLGANSTPTWFLESGERYSGAMSLDEVRPLLDQASPAKR